MIPQRDTKINKLKYGLYVVSTPIGNLRDITLRAIEILKQSEYILCEDTRVSKNLLRKYNIKSQLISNHKFNESKNISKIIKILDSKKIVSTAKNLLRLSTPNTLEIVANGQMKMIAAVMRAATDACSLKDDKYGHQYHHKNNFKLA